VGQTTPGLDVRERIMMLVSQLCKLATSQTNNI
jgi:hypothetical protein